jgi:hypothetical protein
MICCVHFASSLRSDAYSGKKRFTKRRGSAKGLRADLVLARCWRLAGHTSSKAVAQDVTEIDFDVPDSPDAYLRGPVNQFNEEHPGIVNFRFRMGGAEYRPHWCCDRSETRLLLCSSIKTRCRATSITICSRAGARRTGKAF